MVDRQRLLDDLGRRIRESRVAVSLSVSDLARAAGVSRRYVTEAEAGRANLSVLKLAELAEALGISLAELFTAAPTRASERVALVGLRGAGKSTLGPRLALALEAPFVELDARVEELAGMSLAEIFSVHGEAGFRRFEAEALERVLSEGERVVLAAGGSIVADEATFQRLLASCRTVWLHADPADHFQRVLDQGDHRPMRDRPRAMAELETLLASRTPFYSRCELAVRTSGRSVDECVSEVLRLLEPAPGGANPA